MKQHTHTQFRLQEIAHLLSCAAIHDKIAKENDKLKTVKSGSISHLILSRSARAESCALRIAADYLDAYPAASMQYAFNYGKHRASAGV